DVCSPDLSTYRRVNYRRPRSHSTLRWTAGVATQLHHGGAPRRSNLCRSTRPVASIQTTIDTLGVFAGTENNFIPAGYSWTASRTIRLFGFFQRFSRIIICHIVERVSLTFQLLVRRTIGFLGLSMMVSSSYFTTIPVRWVFSVVIRPSNFDFSSPGSISGLFLVTFVRVM